MDTLHNQFNKNQLQLYFNQIKGEIAEIIIDELYSNVTIKVGHHNSRIVNLVAKTPMFHNLIGNFKVGDKIIAKYYLSSNKKNERYYTTATLLEVQKQPMNNH
jgi:molybdopterin-binding protein